MSLLHMRREADQAEAKREAGRAKCASEESMVGKFIDSLTSKQKEALVELTKPSTGVPEPVFFHVIWKKLHQDK